MPVIFISYRRSDSQDLTGRIYDRLVAKFEKKQVFKDVDNIPLSVSFASHLRQVLKKANVILVIIGPNWVNAVDGKGGRRLDDPNDLVRVEVELALCTQTAVIPILVSHARMPLASELPVSMQALVTRNGMPVRPDPDFNNDVERLFSGLEHLEMPVRPQERKSANRRRTIKEHEEHSPVGKSRIMNARAIAIAIIPVLLLIGCVILFFSWDRIITSGKKQIAYNPNIEKELGVEMRLIPAGKFLMGSREGDLHHKSDQFQHEVMITRPFYLSANPVTNGQFRQFLIDSAYDNTRLTRDGDGLKKYEDSIHSASWYDAKAYCEWLSRASGKTYDLPTEAQWEYACRGRALPGGGVEISTDPYWFGKEVSEQQASNSLRRLRDGTKAGDLKLANGFGLYGMHGYRREWCSDWYAKDYYNKSPKEDPRGPPEGSHRVVRGGVVSAVGGPAEFYSAATRHSEYPVSSSGFRVMAVPSWQQ